MELPSCCPTQLTSSDRLLMSDRRTPEGALGTSGCMMKNICNTLKSLQQVEKHFSFEENRWSFWPFSSFPWDYQLWFYNETHEKPWPSIERMNVFSSLPYLLAASQVIWPASWSKTGSMMNRDTVSDFVCWINSVNLRNKKIHDLIRHIRYVSVGRSHVCKLFLFIYIAANSPPQCFTRARDNYLQIGQMGYAGTRL